MSNTWEEISEVSPTSNSDITFYLGARSDGANFVASSREQLDDYLNCECNFPKKCDKHIENE